MSVGEPTSEEAVQNYVSTLYPKRYSGTGFLYHSRIVTELLDGIKFRDGRTSDSVLDVGCGIGFVSQLYPSFDITGVDISDGMLERNPYKWVKAPAEALPFPDASFDWVVCRSLLHHLEDPSKGLAEMVRVLKPGGRWVAWEPNLSPWNDWIRWVSKKTKRFSHWHKNFQPQELIDMVETAGLTITSKKYHGHLAYPTLGFPDILDLHLPIWLGRKLMWLDDQLAKTPLDVMGWAVMLKAVKPLERKPLPPDHYQGTYVDTMARKLIREGKLA